MPRIRIEWVPVQLFGLGILGFDHLQIVYQHDEGEHTRGQDTWFVMEGVRDVTSDGARLGIEGADGRTTLSAANVAAHDELVAKIGTPEYRGSRPLAYGGDAFHAWETMASYARDIEQQAFPYIAYGLPGSPTPTINSSSAIASLLYYSGLDPAQQLPYGVHLSPGTGTLLGTSRDDAMRIEGGFTTLLGGHGRDQFTGGPNAHGIEKLYGGRDNDLFHWSPGFNMVHGGEPHLNYAADGTDVMNYSGAGTITITLNRHSVPHKTPNYVAAFADGLDHLFSIERLQWNAKTDRIVLGKGVGLVEDSLIFTPGPGLGANAASDRETSHLRSGVLVTEHDTSSPPTDRTAQRLLGDANDNILSGTSSDDTLYGGAGNDTLRGGAGGDGYVYLYGDGDDIIDDHGHETDIDELVLAGGITPSDVSVHHPAHAPGDLVLSFARGGRILIKDFNASTASGIDRVIFDLAPAWTREDLQRLAAPVAAVERKTPSMLDDTHWAPAAAGFWSGLGGEAGWLF